MSPQARRRALRAAAAVTAFSLAGCGPRKAPVQAAPSDESAPDATEPTASDADSQASGDVQACAEEVSAAVETATADAADGERIQLTDASTACCETLDAFYSANMDRFDKWPTRDACCELLEWQGGIACTPWGPPPPPAFRARTLA